MTEQHRQNQTAQQQMNCRMRLIMSCFVLVAILILTKLMFLATGYRKQRQILRQHAQASEVIYIPGLRGTLADRNQNLIAQSHRRVAIQAGSEKAEAHQENMDLPMTENIVWKDLPARNGIKPHIYARRTVGRIWQRDGGDTPNTLPDTALGETAIDPNLGLETGLSGLELKWDRTLKAHLVMCKILKDQRRVILSSIHPNGQDVNLTE